MTEPEDVLREPAADQSTDLDREPGEGDPRRRLAEAVRAACVRAALEGYEEAGLAGLCDEGRWEMAVDRMRALNLEALLEG